MTIYNVQLINKANGIDETIEIPEDKFILDAAEQAGIKLNYSCRTGKCISCAGKIIKGEIDDQSDFLQKKEIEAGFFLTCTAYPKSDCVILVDQEDALLDL